MGNLVVIYRPDIPLVKRNNRQCSPGKCHELDLVSYTGSVSKHNGADIAGLKAAV